MRQKILLTGGSGFIGRNILESFLADKYTITAPTHTELDLADTAQVDEFFRTHTFDIVLHTATKPGHRNAKDPTNLFYTNVRMFENLVRHTNKFGKMINFGSGAIYDVSADNRLVEEEQIGQCCGKDEHSFCKYIIYKRIESLQNVIDLNILNHADLVVTLCGHADEHCPMTPPNVKRVHWGFDDPAKAKGSEAEKWDFFQRVRDEIGERIERFAKTGV